MPLDKRQEEIAVILRRDPNPVADQEAAAELRYMLTDMAETGNRRSDPIREVFARIGDKWSPLLLLLLQMRPFRHSTLRRLVGLVSADGLISQRILRLRLRTLVRDGLIVREVVSTDPPRVVYSLTDTGQGLVKQLESLMAWTRDHSETIRLARERFDLQAGDNIHDQD
jgi:DNA-binding HxlR family transcriptional regulator